VPSAPSSDVAMLFTGVRGRGILRTPQVGVLRSWATDILMCVRLVLPCAEICEYVR
jgi:hypothetical protein